MGTDRDRGRHHLGHDTAGRPHSAPDPTPKSEGGPLQPSEPVASRSTEAEATDLVSLRRAKRGDTGAFADLVRANDDDVRNLVWALVGGPDLDELCTRVYVRAFRGLPLAPSTSPRIWLLGIADGTARDALRRRSSQHASESVAGPPIPVDLASRQRLVLASIDAVGLTARETARLTGGDIAVVRELLRESHDAGLRIEHRSAPPHHTDFWNALGRRLLVEQSGPAASRPVDPSATVAEFSEPVARFPTRATTAAARGMAIRVDQQHPRTVPWRPILVTVAVLLGVGVLVGAALSAARHASRHDAGLGETAEKTLDQLDASLARNVVVSGTVRISSTEPEAIASGSYRFIRSNTGSWQITSLNGSSATGYDTARATASTIDRTGTAPTAKVQLGVAPGPPAPTAVGGSTPGDILANVIRAVRAGSGGTATTRTTSTPTTTSKATTTSSHTSTTQGRPIWVVTSNLDGTTRTPSLAGSGALLRVRADSAELIADQSLALPTSLVLSRAGRPVVTVRFSALAVSQQLPNTSFAPKVAPGDAVATTSGGFVPLTAVDLTGSGARAPLTPSYLPGGYVLATAATNGSGGQSVLCYRNGSRQLVITRRPLSDPRSDPFGPQPGTTKPKTSTIASGALSGRTAYAADEPIGHMWVNGPRTQVIIAGDPTMDELAKILASLR